MTTDIIDLAERTFGVTSADLRVTRNTQNAEQVLRMSQDDQQIQALFARLAESGIQPLEPTAEKIEVPLSKTGKIRPDQNPVLDQVRWTLQRDGSEVGTAYHVMGSADKLTFSVTLHDDETFKSDFIQKGDLGHIVVDREGTIRESTVDTAMDIEKALSCEEVCNAICSGGLGATIPQCIARCLAGGPAVVFCSALCSILVSLGCLAGCDTICGSIEG
jgi:hypothetical protein